MNITETLEYLSRARRAAHDKGCPGGSYPCMACCQIRPVAKALDIIREGDAKPSTVGPARMALYDAECMSGCTDSDHADRTQAKHVSALRQFVRAETQGGAR